MMGEGLSDDGIVRRSLIFWFLAAAVALFVAWPNLAELVSKDPDDALRMVQVRDLVAGQGWWDITQHRINPVGGGGLMHWSRIVDAPLAAIIAALTPVVGTWWAERIAFAGWPLLLMAPLFPTVARIGLLLGSRAVALWSPILLAVSMTILFQFTPLRVDHHGWQILLAGMALMLLLRPARPRDGALAGVVVAALLAISLEGLPIAALIAALMAGEWIWAGQRAARDRLFAYLLALTVAAAVAQVVTRGPSALWEKWCDALSLPWLAALAVATVSSVALTSLAQRVPAPAMPGRIARAIPLAVSACLAGACILLVEPACARGPFATLDPIVMTLWYSNVREGLPLWSMFDAIVGYSLAPTIVGLIGTVAAARAALPEDRRPWALVLGAGIGTTVLSLVVMRGFYFAHLFLLPGCAWLVARLWTWGRALPTAGRRIAALLPLLVVLPPTSVMIAVRLLEAAGYSSPDLVTSEGISERTRQCIGGSSVAGLNRLRPALALTPLDVGPYVLQYTHHSVVATGHHRNNHVMAAVLTVFTGDPALAEARSRRLGAQIILQCDDSEWKNYLREPGDNFAKRLHRGQIPDWLEPLEIGDGGVRAWRIKSATPPTR